MHSLIKRLALSIFALSFCSTIVVAQTGSTLEARRKALNDLLAEQWEYRLRTSPLFASFLGDERWNDKLDDFSQEGIDKDLMETQEFLTLNVGLDQVREIERRMKAVAAQLGYQDLKAFNAAIKADPKLHAQSRKQILDFYTRYIDRNAKLPDLFGRLPKPVKEFQDKETSGASYQSRALDGSRPGHVMVNTGDFANRLLLDIETTAYHEGVPGHHVQIAIARELPELPPFRQNEYFTTYTEGWALYSERLGKEVGCFQDPHSYFGHLQDDMLRAIRLVVDTGLHSKHWTRQQVVDFFHEHSPEDEVSVQSEADRHIAWPGQALGYKIGQLEILKLREHSKNQLGAKFDIRSFHDELLGGGALPMDVLKERIVWVTKQQTLPAPSLKN